MADAKPSAKLVSVVAVEPIMAGGVRYEPGSLLSVSAADAAGLVEQGAAAMPAKPAKAADAAPPAA